MLRTIEIAVKKPLHTTPSIIQFLQQSKSQIMQREKESDVVLQRMRIGSEIPLITLSDGVAIRWWVQEGVPGKYSYKPWYSNVFRFAYTLGEQYMKEGKEFKDPADAINHVYIQFLSQRENASLVFPDKKEARKPELELRTLFIKQKMDSQGYVVLDVKELQQNDGKNNQGAFIVTALNKDAIASDKPECFFVKVVRELNNFKDLIKRQEGVEAADPKKSVPRMTTDQLNTFTSLKDHFDVGGRAIGIFPAVHGITLLDLHRNWLCGRASDDALISAWHNVGNVLSRFHNPNLQTLPSSTRCGGKILGGKGLYTHGDLNPSNIMIDAEQGSAMLIDIDGGHNDSEYSGLGIELTNLFEAFDVGIKRTKGYGVDGCIKEAGNIAEMYKLLLDRFESAYLERIINNEVFKRFVRDEIQRKKEGIERLIVH